MSAERHGTENGVEIARSEPDAAATRKEAANLAVAAMSRRVSGGGKSGGMVAGYARPGVDRLHSLREVNELRVKSAEAVVERPGNKVGGLLGLYQQRMPAVVMKSTEGERPVGVAPIATVRGFTMASAKSGCVMHVQKLEKVVTELWAVNEIIAHIKGNDDVDSDQLCMEEIQRLDRGKPDGKLKNHVVITFDVEPHEVHEAVARLKDSSYGPPLFFKLGQADQTTIEVDLVREASVEPIDRLAAGLMDQITIYVGGVDGENIEMTLVDFVPVCLRRRRSVSWEFKTH